jgi:hypothetical protein
VEQNVRSLCADSVSVILNDGNNDFDRFFAKFFGDIF